MLRQFCIWATLLLLQAHFTVTLCFYSSLARLGSKVRLVRDRLRTKQLFRSDRIWRLKQPQWASLASLMHPGGAEGGLTPTCTSNQSEEEEPFQAPVPSFDIAGYLRGQCLSCNECPAYICLSGRVLCDYCGCPPARHVLSLVICHLHPNPHPYKS